MPPTLALTASALFSAVLLLREQIKTRDVSSAIWLPCVWLFFLGSRAPSEWLGVQSGVSTETVMDGSPTDRVIYGVLIVGALFVLLQRRVEWIAFFRRNAWFIAFFVYAAVSIYWSDFPDIALKRWLKGLGDPMMAMIVLSEANPGAALLTLLRRLAAVLLPLSIVFIKYFPQLGRTYDSWSGAPAYTGITMNKNMLGYLLLVFGLMAICSLVTWRSQSRSETRGDRSIAVVLLLMVGWLFWVADTKTPLVSLAAASLAVLASTVPVLRRRFGIVLILAVVVTGALQVVFGISEQALAQVGRDATLTGRTEIWAAVLGLSTNPFIGTGFESFWLGSRLKTMWGLFPVFRPIQAHDGYLEIYLNLGLIGLFLVLGYLVSSYRWIAARLNAEESHELIARDANETIVARFALGYLLAFALYNVTEASFQPLNFLFVILLLATLQSRELRPQPAENPFGLTENTLVLSEPLPMTSPAPDAAATASSTWTHPKVNREWVPRQVREASRRATKEGVTTGPSSS
jgi:exopolysaccharide production protein ExoQ